MEYTIEADVTTEITATIIPADHCDKKSKDEMRAFT
jgi:hypothetical protein